MKIIILLFGGIFVFQNAAHGQLSSDFNFQFDVNRIHESLSLSKTHIETATEITDLNQYFKPDYVRDYKHISISAKIDGKKRSETSPTKSLTDNQKELLMSADANTDIQVSITYLPENNLKNNELKNFEYSFKIYPEQEAHFGGGQKMLHKYLDEKAFQQLTKEDFKIYQLTVLTFGITSDGKVVDVDVMTSSGNDSIDQLLTDALCQMPDWIPAQYANGHKIRQEFALTAGDHTSCTINLINIRDKYPLEQ